MKIVEPKTTDLFKSIISNYSVFVDVGSECGYYTFIASKYMNNGEIITIEPEKARFDVLRSSIEKKKNPNVNIVAHNICVGDYNGEIILYTGGTPSVVKSISSIKKRILNNQITSEIKTLDSLLEGVDVDFIKIDVEGYELNVLEGCRVILKTKKPALLLEIHDTFLQTFGKGPEDIFNLLFQYGYQWEYIEGAENSKTKNKLSRYFCE